MQIPLMIFASSFVFVIGAYSIWHRVHPRVVLVVLGQRIRELPGSFLWLTRMRARTVSEPITTVIADRLNSHRVQTIEHAQTIAREVIATQFGMSSSSAVAIRSTDPIELGVFAGRSYLIISYDTTSRLWRCYPKAPTT